MFWREHSEKSDRVVKDIAAKNLVERGVFQKQGGDRGSGLLVQPGARRVCDGNHQLAVGEQPAIFGSAKVKSRQVGQQRVFARIELLRHVNVLFALRCKLDFVRLAKSRIVAQPLRGSEATSNLLFLS